MASDNGTTGLVNGDGGIKSDSEFEAMVDASEKPPKGTVTPLVAQRRPRGMPAAAATATPSTPAEIQAARTQLYELKSVPEPLWPIFNRLPPEEIVFIIAHIEHAAHGGYRTGLAAAAEMGGTAQCGQDHEKYNAVIAGLLEAVGMLDGDRPNVAGCLERADKAYGRLIATATAGG